MFILIAYVCTYPYIKHSRVYIYIHFSTYNAKNKTVVFVCQHQALCYRKNQCFLYKRHIICNFDVAQGSITGSVKHQPIDRNEIQ